MIIFHTPEERWANALWEVPLAFGNFCVKEVLFIPSGPVYPEGGIAQLILRDLKEEIAALSITEDLKRFQTLSFQVQPHRSDYRTLLIRKDIALGKNIALPISLIQVNLW